MITSSLKGESLSKLFRDENLFHQALTHKSFHNENTKSSPGHNERLEFLGDAVLDLILSDCLFNKLTDFDEGGLSKLRASLVNETALAELAIELELGPHLKLGKGETATGGISKPRLLSSVLEALIGAIYVDQGFEKTKDFTLEIFKQRLQDIDLSVHFKSDYKTRLQEKLQDMKKRIPVYKLLKEEGPDHSKVFHVALTLGEDTLSTGTGKSKKQAEQDAAKKALEIIESEEA
ncbi:MAG: ribonuclease III [Bdellovibrionota bacterium]